MDSRQAEGRTERAEALTALAGETFDFLVIGGGITGCGIAREAALAGYRVALVERDDFAAGTSSRSSRLIHGGVRYLEHGHLGMVFESSHERRVLMALAPHLVRPLAFTWPVYTGARVPKWKVRAGLLLYDVLALFRNVGNHESLDAAGILAREPALATERLEGGARYWDAATNDTRLTLATARGARASGAVVLNHAGVVGPLRNAHHRLAGALVHDHLANQTLEVRARVVINATGPWSDATAALTGESSGHQVLGSAGTHVLVPRHRIGNRDAVTIVSPLDGRVMFVLPAGAHTIIGTTEGPAKHGPDEIRATERDVTYLLDTANRLFPHAALGPADVISAWCGIRPLAAARAGEHSANAASREHAITHRADGLVSVTGGKLTTYRAMAADVFRHALRELGDTTRHVVPTGDTRDSAHTPLPGGNFASRDALLADVLAATRDDAMSEHLMHAYGSEWTRVWQHAAHEANHAEHIVPGLPYLMAEVSYAIAHEWACTLSDVLIRRTHIAFETRDHGRSAARRIAPLMGAALGWSDEQQHRAVAEYDGDVTRIFSIEK
jgi:glycerol-3-phosphate dehydrogenase